MTKKDVSESVSAPVSEKETGTGPAATQTITGDKVVSFHYRLCEVDGDGNKSDWLEESAEREPLLYLHGHGNVIPGLEQAMAGKKPGDNLAITLKPEEAYGHRQPNSVQRVPIKHLHRKSKQKIVPGSIASVQTDKGIRNVVVVKAGKFNVDVDTNHPLAGKTLHYEIDVVNVRDATPEELAHKHVHGPGGHQH